MQTRANVGGYLTMVVGIRRYRCPHCFEPYWRPCRLLKILICPVEAYNTYFKPVERSDRSSCRIFLPDQTATVQETESRR